MTDLRRHEFVILRDTIRSRGTARPLAFLAGFCAWAIVLLGILIWLPNPIASVLPLSVLLATFEVVRGLHLNVERIGRYVQVFHEESAEQGAGLTPPSWERAAMGFGPVVPGAGGHPLFLPVFVMACLVNFLSVLLPAPLPIELGLMAVPHAAVAIWMLYCDRSMRKQRVADLARYRELRDQARA